MKFANRPSHPTASARAMTLVEMLVTVGVGSMVLLGIVMIFMTSSRSFAALSNYVTLDQSSRNALDQMSRDIRKAKNLVSFAPNELVFNYAGTTNLTYFYDPSSRQLLQWKTGGATNALLTVCDSLQFSMYNSIPLPGGAFTDTTVPSAGKSISVCWKCSRTVLGRKLTTENTQEALIVIRNKPVS